MPHTLHKTMLHSRNVAMQQCSNAAMQLYLKAAKLQSYKAACLQACQHASWPVCRPAKTQQYCAQPQAHYITLDKLAFLCTFLRLFKKFLIKSLPSTINLPIMCITKSMDA